MRQNRAADAIAAAEQALKIAPDNRDAHRVLGTIYATPGDLVARARPTRQAQQENIDAGDRASRSRRSTGPVGRADANLRAMLARLYVSSGELRQGDSDADGPGQAGARLAGRPAAAGRSVLGGRPDGRRRSVARRGRLRTSRSSIRRSAISTGGSGAGRRRRGRTSRRS